MQPLFLDSDSETRSRDSKRAIIAEDIKTRAKLDQKQAK